MLEANELDGEIEEAYRSGDYTKAKELSGLKKNLLEIEKLETEPSE